MNTIGQPHASPELSLSPTSVILLGLVDSPWAAELVVAVEKTTVDVADIAAVGDVTTSGGPDPLMVLDSTNMYADALGVTYAARAKSPLISTAARSLVGLV